MANTKKFAVKNGLQTQNIDFVSPSETNTITMTMLDADTLSVSGNTGQLFSITDNQSGVIFAVNDVSGIPSIEVDDTGTIRLAETFGNVLIGTTIDNGIDKLQVNGTISATSFTGSVVGNASTATKLATARTINGVAFDGTADIVIKDDTKVYLNQNPTIQGPYMYWNTSDGMGRTDIINHRGLGGGGFDFWIKGPNDTSPALVASIDGSGNFSKNSATATKLQTARKINGVPFDGTVDIDTRFKGQLTTLSSIDTAITFGVYSVEAVNIAGLYSYGVLIVDGRPGVSVHQTYYAHNDEGLGSIAVRQSWDNGVNWSPWRIIDKHALLLTGGTLTGTLNTKAPIYEATLTDIGLGNDAPIRVPQLTFANGAVGYMPMIHGSTVTTGSGYQIQGSLGLYRGSNTWANGGFYLAVGGNDNYPTESFYFKTGGILDHSSGNITVNGTLSFPNDSGGVQGTMGTSDSYRIVGRSTAADAGYLEIATADNGSEPIYVRQYTGTYTTLTRTATILDSSGNTQFPGTVTATTFSGALTGNASTATKLATARTLAISGDATGSASFDGSANTTISVTLANKDVANGIPTLDASGFIKSSQLPSYVDDVLEYANLTAFPASGESSKIYIALDTNKIYRWSGSVYVEISGSALADAAIKLYTARTINGVAFDGTANITIADSTKLPLTGGTLTGAVTFANGIWNTVGDDAQFGDVNQSGIIGIRSNNIDTHVGLGFYMQGAATTAPTALLKVLSTGVADLNVPLNCSQVNGNAATATALQTARTINGTSFDGSANITVPVSVTTLSTQGVDLNTFQTPGFYSCPANATASTLLNCPTTNAFSLLVEKHAGVKQTVTEYMTSGVKTYSRNMYNSVWGAWYRVYTTIDAPTSGATLANDTTTNASTFYPTMAYNTTSGNFTTAYVSSTELYFNPSTGQLNATMFNSLSDERKKTNIAKIDNALAKVQALRGVQFTWKDNGVASLGVIAQEIEQVLPEVVSTSKDTGEKSVNYNSIIGVLIEAIKEQQVQINILKEQLGGSNAV